MTNTAAQYSLRFFPSASDEDRATTAAAIAAVRPFKAPRQRREPDALERRGAKALAAPDAPSSKRTTTVLRIYYRSEGGEVLAFATPALTGAEASAITYDLAMSDALGWVALEELPGGRVREDAQPSETFRAAHRRAPLTAFDGAIKGARLVTLPSQRMETVIREEESVAPSDRGYALAA